MINVFQNREINERREAKLKALGLTQVSGQRFRVPKLFMVPDGHQGASFDIDFSAIDENLFTLYLTRQIYLRGVEVGKAEIADALKKVLSFASTNGDDGEY